MIRSNVKRILAFGRLPMARWLNNVMH